MSTMNISLPDSLKSFVDEQVATRGYGTSSEYLRELIRRDQDRARLRALLLEGATSPTGAPADKAYFDSLQARVRRRARG
jgi:antitoxin ParD1/3/4